MIDSNKKESFLLKKPESWKKKVLCLSCPPVGTLTTTTVVREVEVVVAGVDQNFFWEKALNMCRQQCGERK